MSEEKKRIISVIPAYNEGERIGNTIETINQLPVDEVIVVSDGSTDNTTDVARNLGAKVIELGRRRGKGAALTVGVGAVCLDSDVILLIDADTGTSASNAWVLVNEVLTGNTDIAVGILPSHQSGGVGFVQSLTRWVLWLATGSMFSAPLSGQRAIRGQCALRLLPFARGFGAEAGMNVDAVKHKLTVTEVVVDMRHRRSGKSLAGFLHRGRQLIDIIIAMSSRIGIAKFRINS